jgi:hypothetical protein
MRKSSIIMLACAVVVVLAALVYGSARVTEHMQPERGQPANNVERYQERGTPAPSETGTVPPNARSATPSSGRDALSNPGGGNADNVPAGARQ